MKLKKKWIITIPVVIAALLFAGLYYYFNKTNENTFTISDNKWIEEHLTTVVDFSILSNYPVFGEGGVFKAFINDFSKDTGFEFNTITYLKESEVDNKGYRFRILSNQEELKDNDILLQEDAYMLFGKKESRLSNLSSLSGKTIGILAKDSDEIIYYLKSITDLKYKTYEESSKLFDDYNGGTIEYIVIPNMMYLNETIFNEKYNIQYVFTELSKKIVLTLPEDEASTEMNKIVRKYFNNWKEKKYIETYNNNLLNYIITKGSVNDKEKAEFLTKNYVYGYVENTPYQVKGKKDLEGIAAEYINRMERLTNADFITYEKYDSLDSLKEAVELGKVDIYFNYYDYENSNYLSTISPFEERYVVLGRTNDDYVIRTFESLKGLKVSIVEDNAIYNYFKDVSKASLVPFESLNDLLKDTNNNLIVVDKEVYDYYKNNKLKNYEVLYENTITSNYNFMIKNDESNKVFYKIFNYIIGTNSYYKYRNQGINILNKSVLEKSTFEEIYITILAVILIPLVLISLALLIFKHRKKVKVIKKEERRKYTDMLTSLKNRNYLNLNMKLWNDSKKYPQSIIIADLNNVKYVNDNYGHEQGDNLIIGAASILVNTQLENSEIIRTDGNEFLIYLVGYSEQQTSTYAKKLTKEFKNLPYGFGAAIGYSMIMDEIKTIDDAINEATLEMRKDKEEYK